MPDWLSGLLTHPVVLLSVGGGAGANARYWFGLWAGRQQLRLLGAVEFPWGTFLINVFGSVVLGACAAAFLTHPDPARRTWYLFLATGFCGGFTTFSTFSLEAFELLRDGRIGAATAYALGSVLAGVAGVAVAMRAMGK